MTDFSQPFEMREFNITLTTIHIPNCVFCNNSSTKMVKISKVTAQHGIETSHLPDYICFDCATKIADTVLLRDGLPK